MIGPDIVKDTEAKVQSDRKKSYADLKRKDIEYEVSDKVFLKVFPWRNVLRFGKKGKLSPRFIVGENRTNGKSVGTPSRVSQVA